MDNFICCLRDKYDVTHFDMNEWRYTGGNKSSRHVNYWKLTQGDKPFPPYEEYCVCGHKIQEQCYITNDTVIVVVGNCCVKRFITHSTRTCKKCNKSHQNRKDNLCKDCRKIIIPPPQQYPIIKKIIYKRDVKVIQPPPAQPIKQDCKPECDCISCCKKLGLICECNRVINKNKICPCKNIFEK